MSHLTAVRIRLVSLAALLHDSTHIDESVWEWTGLLIGVHMGTLAWMEHVARDAEQAAAERRGQIRAYERSGERGESGALVDQTSEEVTAVLASARAAGSTPGRLRGRVTSRLPASDVDYGMSPHYTAENLLEARRRASETHPDPTAG